MSERTETGAPCVLFAGGGTGGHLFPAIAVAMEIRSIRPKSRITFAGTRKKIEERVVPEHGYQFAPIWISGFRRGLSIGNLLFPLKVMVATVQSFFLIRRIRPGVVIGTGGYVAGPVLFTASMLGVPTMIQEQNSHPGVTTRLLASIVDEVHVTFENSLHHFRRRENIRVTGNPTRGTVGTISREKGRAFFRLDGTRRTLLVFGGSLGAASINRAMLGCLGRLTEAGVQVIWQTGQEDHARVKAAVASMAGHVGGSVRLESFIERMEYAYGACDLALCRAGATTLAELTRGGVPSVLVPYPYAAADHQTANAKAMVEAGAAVMVRDDQLSESLESTIQGLLHDEAALRRMAERARSIARPDAAAELARAALTLAEKGDGGRGTRL